MVMSKYSPSERLMRKRVAARLRQQRCRARKRAAAAAAKKQDQGDSVAGDQSVTSSASTAEPSSKNAKPQQKAPTKIIISNNPTAQGARFLPPQPRAPVYRPGVPPHYPHIGTSQHPLAPTHWDPYGAPHMHYAYGAHGHVPPPRVIYEVHHHMPTTYGVPPPARFPPVSHPLHASVAPRPVPPSTIEFPATVSRTSSRDESTGSSLSSPAGSPDSLEKKTSAVKTPSVALASSVAGKEVPTKDIGDDANTPSTAASSPPKSLLLSNEKAAIDAMLCLGMAADQVEKASA